MNVSQYVRSLNKLTKEEESGELSKKHKSADVVKSEINSLQLNSDVNKVENKIELQEGLYENFNLVVYGLPNFIL